MNSRQKTFTKISSLTQAGKLKQAEQLALAAQKQYPRAFFLHNILGAIHGMRGQWKDSAKYFAKAVKIAPKSFEGFRNLGNAERHLGNLNAAQKHLTKALSIKAAFPEGWLSLGLVYLDKMENQKAIAAFEKSLILKPDFDVAALNLFTTLDRNNEIEKLRSGVARFENASKNHPVARLFTAILLHRDKEFEPARDILKTLAFDQNRTHGDFMMELMRVSQLSKIEDKLGNYENAYGLFTQANTLNTKASKAGDHNPEGYMDGLGRRLAHFDKGFSSNWKPLQPPDDSPVFLVGFPRSGTTLLETFLGGHSQITVSDERPLVRALTRSLGTFGGQNLQALENINEASANKARKAYWFEWRKYCGDGEVKIDKLPLNLVSAADILRVFPKAKFILALRDPADAVLSCFMQPFKLNDAMATFETAQSTAQTYDQVMQLWQCYTDELTPAVFQCRYEDLVSDNETVLRGLIDFLGLEWQENVLDHLTNIQTRADIRTPSYAQVSQPLYTTAMARWKHYEHMMPEAMEILQPWRKHFGYSD